MAVISASESSRRSSNPLKLISMSSVINRELPSSFVAPMNCSKQGWRHQEAMFISLSNKRLLWGDKINWWICFTATWQPLNLPRKTFPHPPTPKHLSVKCISSLDVVQSQGSFCLYSSNACWTVDSVISSSCICSSLAVNVLSNLSICCSASSLAWGTCLKGLCQLGHMRSRVRSSLICIQLIPGVLLFRHFIRRVVRSYSRAERRFRLPVF